MEAEAAKIVQPGDCDQMAAAMDGLISDRELRTRFGAAARQRACERYSLESMLAAYEGLYRRLSPNGRGEG